MSETLPYHCPEHRADHLLSPCGLQLARVKALREKGINWLGPLAKCEVCRGAKLVTREAGETMASVELSEAEAKRVLPPEVLAAAGISPSPEPSYPGGEGELPGAPAGEDAPPAAVLGLVPGYCKRHPEVKAMVRKDGKSTGRCRECMKADVYKNRWGQKQGENAGPSLPTETIPLPPEKIAEGRAAVDRLVEKLNPEVPVCTNHPERPARIDRLGRSMRLCEACLRERGRINGLAGQKSGKIAPPVAIPLNLGKYAELKAWLEGEAAENERTLSQEIMYRLERAMRLAEAG